MWPRQTTLVGLCVAVIGLSVLMVGLGEITATEWVLDPLHYHSVEYHRGFRGPPSIHLISPEGGRYRLPERLWGKVYEGPELVRTLEQDDAAAVRVVGGGNGLLHGHPTVTRLEVGSLVLETSPRHPARAPSMIGFGPMLLVLGLGMAWRGRRG
ncbi:MAG: hypothetical protein WD960_11415 [Gemmatimonadota bacterium]